MRVGFVGARPSMAMMDSPKSRASGPTDMTAQASVSLDSLARTSGIIQQVALRTAQSGISAMIRGGGAYALFGVLLRPRFKVIACSYFA